MHCKEPFLAVIASLLVAASSAATAGEASGPVSKILARQSDGITYFYVEGVATGKPACATHAYWMIKDEESAAGKTILALVMSAQANGLRVTVHGSDTCTRWHDGEDVLWIQVGS